MRIFLAGATGALGSRLGPLLVAGGHHVTGTTRSDTKAAGLRAQGVEPATLDALDREAVKDAVAKAQPDVIVHQLTAISGPANLRRFDNFFAATNRLRTEGTDNLLAAAAASNVSRVVAQSFTGWPNERTGGPVKTEDDPLDPNPTAASRQSIAAIRHVEEAVTSAPSGIVLRYGGFYGPGNALGTGGELLEMVRERKLPVVGSGAGVWSFIHIDDAVDATILAIVGDQTGLFNIVDDEPAPVSTWLPYLADAIGAKPPRHLPAWLVRPLLGEHGVSLMTEIRGSSNAKAKRELGWSPRYASWRDGFRYGLG
jgi:2-alkyl-3-oxoalkanoate reductase